MDIVTMPLPNFNTDWDWHTRIITNPFFSYLACTSNTARPINYCILYMSELNATTKIPSTMACTPIYYVSFYDGTPNITKLII